MGEKLSPEILVILCYDLLLLPHGVSFQLFYWNFSTCYVPLWKMSIWKCCLSDQCHNYPYCWVLFKCPHLQLHAHLADHWQASAVQGRGRVEWAGLTNRAGRGGSAWKGVTFEDYVGLVSTVMKISIQPPFEWF